jgi:hypothetical protein
MSELACDGQDLADLVPENLAIAHESDNFVR